MWKVTCICHFPYAIALACCNGTKFGKKCWVNCLCIIQEGTNNVLDAFDLLQGEGLCGVDLLPRDPCAILDLGRLVGRDWFVVFVLCEGFVDVHGHIAIGVSFQVR
jgi:hypothetical protein